MRSAISGNLMPIFKIFITGFLFFWFGVICILGNIFFVPVLFFGLQKYKLIRNFCRFLVRNAWKFFIFCTDILGYARSNADILKTLGKNSEIIVCNHTSLLDIVFFLSFVKDSNCIVKGELAKNIFLSSAIKACGYILNTQNEECLEISCKALKEQENLIVFPEGSRTKDKIVFHKAAAYIAIKSAKTLTPVFLHMNPKSLKKGVAWYDTPDITINYKFNILKSIDLDTFYPQKSAPIRARLLNAYLQEIYNEEFKNDR
ncbi:1-acyl-sn-glycerol-3-phosphate acyltransferase [Campylobacter hyointestinalis]|uniref:lysophospholipid acyltransferase family protein n=2 Tax=Campylobacter hyointestinalis TaxID=198 RepID=UPI00068C677A|nr:lysophospholipid acyltransferase family protein [Campylobacter hyointestinalis]TXK48315.1 1-acyl-sn-glycerol-3-phosphate acyltransferase [Campylobacter hyointestinalis]SFT36356.1 1-acyl-sn-glycerol-3-phosphate acyltransferases [Campylobacter hyointestinalis]SUW88846.1 1-acyl-sn-glycerol-3-phosphate acyltransferase [Campylobacter hyointestinalis]SUW90618.1 1-acyl-sn-glycerol-3-phosphate acyltransferase [Campylobacter hyointestinalis]